MKKPLFYAVLPAAALLAGCSTVSPETAPAPEPVLTQEAAAPAVPPEPESALLDEMQKTAARVTEAGGLASIGTGGSKSLDLALNRAKANGRIALADLLKTRMAALEKAFIEESGIPAESLVLSGFNMAVKSITEQQIAGSVAYKLKYEPAGDAFMAYAVMVLDPAAIASRLENETELYARLQPSKAFAALRAEIAAYQTFKAAQR